MKNRDRYVFHNGELHLKTHSGILLLPKVDQVITKKATTGNGKLRSKQRTNQNERIRLMDHFRVKYLPHTGRIQDAAASVCAEIGAR